MRRQRTEVVVELRKVITFVLDCATHTQQPSVILIFIPELNPGLYL